MMVAQNLMKIQIGILSFENTNQARSSIGRVKAGELAYKL